MILHCCLCSGYQIVTNAWISLKHNGLRTNLRTKSDVTIQTKYGPLVGCHVLQSSQWRRLATGALRQHGSRGRWLDEVSWWRHQMETISALLAICAGSSPVPCEFPAQRPVTRRFDVFWINGWVNTSEACDLRRNRAHYDVIIICLKVIWPSGWQPRRWFDESAQKYTSCRGNKIFRNELMLFTVPNKHQAISNHRADMPTLLPVVTWTVSQNILRCSFFMFFNCLHWWPFRLVSLKFVLMS